jgi:hypothetical protein
VYHIFSPQGQTQFAGTEGADNTGRLGTPFGEADELSPTVRRAVRGLDQPGRLVAGDGFANLLKSGGKRPGAARKTEA